MNDLPVVARVRSADSKHQRFRDVLTSLSVPHVMSRDSQVVLGLAPWSERRPPIVAAIVTGSRTLLSLVGVVRHSSHFRPGQPIRLVGLVVSTEARSGGDLHGLRDLIGRLQASRRCSLHLHVAIDSPSLVRAYEALGFVPRTSTARFLEMERTWSTGES